MIITELFKRGYTPTKTTNKYNVLPNPSGLTIEYSGGKVYISWTAAKKPDEEDDNLGAFGYNVYLNGQLLGFTTSTSYTYTGSNPFGTYTVKTAYKNSTSNMSSGISKSLNQQIEIKSNVTDSVNLNVGDPSYSPVQKPFIVYENGVDVTSSATVTTTITDSDGNIVSSISTDTPNTYTIKYTVKYDGESGTTETIVNVLGIIEGEIDE